MPDQNQTVSLGCGTLILIAIIVMMFSNSSDNDVERELKRLRTDVGELKRAVEAQTKVLEELKAKPSSQP